MSGKGSSPRNCFSSEFKSNYDEINWGKKNVIVSVSPATPTYRISYMENKKNAITKYAIFHGLNDTEAAARFYDKYTQDKYTFLNIEPFIE